MRKLVVSFLIVLAMAFTESVQAQSNFDLNVNYSNQFIFKAGYSRLHYGRVVGIKTYLSLRAEPSVNSREIMRIPNGARLELREQFVFGWWEVLSVNGDNFGAPAAAGIGWGQCKICSS